MLHRLALRVLPSLTLSVTEPDVRKRKRLIMLAPGLAAFAVYRIVKYIAPLSDPVLLLGVSGAFSAVTALWAYRMGRDATLSVLRRQDGLRRIGWLVGWIGFAYGVQLSLMVLALLRVLAHYDFLRHPDGPAMMAMIIACTSVARDAFEIGHIRKLQQRGHPVLTFPDGAPFREFILGRPRGLLRWVLSAAAIGVLSALGIASLGEIGRSEAGQFVLVGIVAGGVALAGFLAGGQRPGGWTRGLSHIGWAKLFQFWWWPGVAFGATYYLVVLGVVVYVWRQDAGVWVHGLTAGSVSALMALYGYYLGFRRAHEDRIQQAVPSSLLRCPFVMGILSKSGASPNGKLATSDMVLEESGRRN